MNQHGLFGKVPGAVVAVVVGGFDFPLYVRAYVRTYCAWAWGDLGVPIFRQVCENPYL